ncbi:MAG TPA: cadherin-like beta sandwich domain-containing protein [Spirochaetota bacterium]|nr:cadherin-like beta sandwich domain-containing protein [Spirochaetota bacterium]
MKLIRKYLFMIIMASIAAFSGCGEDIAGVIAGDVSDGLSSNYFIANLTVEAPALYNEEDPNSAKLNFTYDFDSTTWSYVLHVPESIDIITITPTKDHKWAEIYLNEVNPANILASGSPSGPITLNPGLNVIKVIVVSQDQQQMDYTINVTRHTEAYADATLSTLSIADITLSPLFDPGITAYSGNVNTNTINVTAEANSAEFKKLEILSNGIEYSNWTAIPVIGGMNTIEARCTGGDGNTQIYTMNIFRQQTTTTADLVALSIKDRNLNEVSFDETFDKDTLSYKASMSIANSPVALVAQAESSTATISVTVNTVSVAPANFGAITLQDGYNYIEVTVKNGAIVKTYSIEVLCTTSSANADLKSLKVGIGTISSRPIYPGTFVRGANYHDPNVVKFDKTKTDYVTVIYGYSSMNITAVVDDATAQSVVFTAQQFGEASPSTVTSTYSSGTAAAAINLVEGRVTTVTITVKAASGKTKTYNLHAKLLNAEEFYWGIYAPSMDKSKSTWTKPVPGTFERDGYVAGHVKWVVTTTPTSTITLTGYNDGKLDFLYNDGGIIINGTHKADLKSITVKDGWDLTANPPFLIKTAGGEYVAELDYHLWIDDSDPAEQADSYTRMKYLGSDWLTMPFKDTKPYPFTATYNWFESWSDGL